jgi:1-acyl-sn-glycerol-3-phosphate acyltransferase
VAKKELERIPFFGPSWKAAGHISVDRQDRASAIRSLERAGQVIREDHSSVIIFPEGTRSEDGTLLPFKKGAFMLAIQTGVDIIPTAVIGTRAILPKGAWRVRSGPITVRFGAPIRTTGYTEKNREALIHVVRERIEELRSLPVESP